MSLRSDDFGKSAKAVKRRSKLSAGILIAAYLAVWVYSLIVFWFFSDGSDAMGYSLVFLWMLLPAATFVTSLFIGKNNYWGKWKWISPIAFGIMYMLAEYGTFSAANMAAFHKVNMPYFEMIPAGAVISAIGLGIGAGIHHAKAKRAE